MSTVHCVVVWEWFDDSISKWLPYGPAVSQHLERAHGKQLTRVILSDADPVLVGCYVNLRTQTQCVDRPEGTSIECGVRRVCYSVSSPAGRGARWEWARATRQSSGKLPDSAWEVLPMDIQCRIEEAWSRGEAAADLSADALLACPWRVELASRTALGPGGAVKVVRRIQQAPYPLTRAPSTPSLSHGVQGRRALSIPHQHTGSSTKSSASTASGKSCHSHQSLVQRAPAKLPKEARPVLHPALTSQPMPAKDKGKPNLARQILHNLNIFSNKTSGITSNGATSASQEELSGVTSGVQRLDADSSSTRSGRRPSVDTVSTYLSHESKDSLNQPPVGDLLNCSVGSDEVFETAAPQAPPSRPKTPSNGSIVGVDAASSVISGFVRVVESVQWGALCPPCLATLDNGSNDKDSRAVVVSLTHCNHMMHLACLNAILMQQQRTNKGALYIQCPVCSRVYGEMRGNQPAGSMAWCVQPRPLPNHPPTTNTIQITYNMMSGVQSAEHPSPGHPYYAVGFPRYSYLPDTPLGRRILNLLSLAWERRLLFTIGRSVTTGREDVVTWAPGLEQRAERSLYAGGPIEAVRFLDRVGRQLAAKGVVDEVETGGEQEMGLYQELA